MRYLLLLLLVIGNSAWAVNGFDVQQMRKDGLITGPATHPYEEKVNDPNAPKTCVSRIECLPGEVCLIPPYKARGYCVSPDAISN